MSEDYTGRLANPKPWSDVLPQPIFAGLSQWVKAQTFELHHRRWRTEGKSGSFVASVLLQPPHGMLVGAILKILPRNPSPSESRAVKLAEEFGPESFVDTHITRTIWIGPLPGDSGSWLHLQRVAQAGAAKLLLLSELLDDADLGEYCYAILSAIATEWNNNQADSPPVLISPREFLLSQLEGRLPGLREFAHRANLDFNRPADVIQLPGRPDSLPNPLKVLRHDVDQPEVTVYRGKGHGDLHCDNILIPVNGKAVDAKSFQLIDTGRFSPKLPISWDPARLMLSLVTSWLPGLAPRSAIRSSLAELVLAPHEFPSSPPIAGYLQVAARVREAAALWAIRRDLVSEWADQHDLVMAAAALRAVARDTISDADRWWHLELAALALRPFLLTANGNVASMPPPTPPTGRRNPPVATEEPPVLKQPTGATRAMLRTEFSRMLSADWQDLADLLGIPPQDRDRFSLGQELAQIWDWLEVRGKVAELRIALTNIGRDDLARLLETSETE